MPKTYFITTFGCQANHSDSERIAGVLEVAGFVKAKNEAESDILIFNSCSVRQSVEDRIFGLNKKLRQLKMKNRGLKIILTGCMAHYSEEQLKKRLPEIDIFLPIKELQKLPELLTWRCDRQVRTKEYLSFSPKYYSYFRAFVPISTGCNNFCSYCIVPYSRGREYDRPTGEIITEVKNLVQKNYKEIWLLGQNVNSYKFKIRSSKLKITVQNLKLLKNKDCIIDFPNLLKIINDIPGDFWIRFTSPHPKDFSNDLIKAMAECDKFSHYLNLPVQSGDNEILKKMNRPYTREGYINLVNKIRMAISDIALSTDVIVGFPGETEKQFQNTVKLFQEIKFDTAYISEYSERQGTLAAKKFKDDVSKTEKARRKKYLTKVLSKMSLENNKKLIGKILDILVDEMKSSPSSSPNRFFGRTGGNKVVEFLVGSAKADSLKIGEFVKAKILSASPWKLKAIVKNYSCVNLILDKRQIK